MTTRGLATASREKLFVHENFSAWSSLILTYYFLLVISQILDGIVARNMSGTVLLSADSHWSAVFQIQKGIYEFVLSPLGAFSALGTSRGRRETELAFIAGSSYFSTIDVRIINIWEPNFLLLTILLLQIDTAVPEAPLDLKIFAAKNPNSPLYSLNLPLSATVTS